FWTIIPSPSLRLCPSRERHLEGSAQAEMQGLAHEVQSPCGRPDVVVLAETLGSARDLLGNPSKRSQTQKPFDSGLYSRVYRVLKGASAMQIGAVAKKIGLSVDAIRFYERSALLPRPPRTAGGFRRYGETDLETLAFIRRVQGLGFKLSEIRGLLRLRADC